MTLDPIVAISGVHRYYVSACGRLQHSSDGGQSWQDSGSVPALMSDLVARAVGPGEPDLFAIAGSQVVRRRPGETAFSALPVQPTSFSSRLWEDAIADTIYVVKKDFTGLDDELFVSSNGGDGWIGPIAVPHGTEWAARSGSVLLTGGSNFAPLRFSPNEGATWFDVLAEEQPIVSLATEPLTGVVYAAGVGGMFRRIGQWARISSLPWYDAQIAALFETNRILICRPSGGPFDVLDATTGDLTGINQLGGCTAVATDRHHPQKVYVGTAGTIFRSDDGAQTWHPTTAGIPEQAHIATIKFDPTDSAIAYAVASGNVLRTDDGGMTWKPAMGGLSPQSVSSLAVSESDPEVLYASIRNVSIARSNNGGESWLVLPVPMGKLPAAPLFVDPTDANVLFAAFYESGADGRLTAAGLLQSLDGGETWFEVYRGHAIVALAYTATGPGVIYAGTRFNGVLRSYGGR